MTSESNTDNLHAEPVATVKSLTNGSYHRNYKLEWHKNVPEGARLYAAPQAQRADALDSVRQAMRDYHFALDSRQHGGVAADRAIKAIESALDMHWQQGWESDRRAALAAHKEV